MAPRHTAVLVAITVTLGLAWVAFSISEGMPANVTAVASNPVGDVIAIAIFDTHQVTLWNFRADRIVGRLDTVYYPKSLRFVRNGSELAIGGVSGPSVEIWDVRRCTLKIRIPCQLPSKNVPELPRKSVPPVRT